MWFDPGTATRKSRARKARAAFDLNALSRSSTAGASPSITTAAIQTASLPAKRESSRAQGGLLICTRVSVIDGRMSFLRPARGNRSFTPRAGALPSPPIERKLQIGCTNGKRRRALNRALKPSHHRHISRLASFVAESAKKRPRNIR